VATRERILEAALGLLAEGGSDAVSTRAVSAAAGVQAPTIYRLFGDKQGLLDELATHGVGAYMAEKVAREPTDDPVADLRAGWDLHVGFGLANPALYTLMYGTPRPTPAAKAAFDVLTDHIRRIGRAGRLRVGEERAAQLVHAAGRGTTLSLIGADVPDPGLSELAREAVIGAITTDAPAVAAPGPVPAAVAMLAELPYIERLTPGEQSVMAEWLERVINGD
jgi:AcrR family transcriptional regulator